MEFEILNLLRQRIAGPYETLGKASGIAERAQINATCYWGKGKLAKAMLAAIPEYERQTGIIGKFSERPYCLYKIRHIKSGDTY